MEQCAFRTPLWAQLFLRKRFAVVVVVLVAEDGDHRSQQLCWRRTQNRKISDNQIQQLIVVVVVEFPIPTERLFEFVCLFGIVVLEHVFQLLVPES